MCFTGQIGDALERGRVVSLLNVINANRSEVENIHFPYPFYALSNPSNSVCIFVIDTEEVRNAVSCDKQRQWLRTKMAEIKNQCKFSIALGHTPSRSSGNHGCVEQARPVARLPFRTLAFWEAELLGRVDMQIAGHDHQLSYEGLHHDSHVYVVGAGGGSNSRELYRTPYIGWPKHDRLPETRCGDKSAASVGRQDCQLGFLKLELNAQGSSVVGNANIYGTFSASSPASLQFSKAITGQGLRNVGQELGDACSAPLRRCGILEEFVQLDAPARAEL